MSVLVGLLLLIIGRMLLQVMLYRSGFISISADEFGRTFLAAQWAQAPHTIWAGPWLPFHMFTFGTALRLNWDLLLMPRIIGIYLGLIAIVLMYFLARQLFDSRKIGLISAFFLAVNPVHIWLSSTPLTAVPHGTLVLAAVLSFVLFLKRDKPIYIYIGAVMLALANGFRFEGWMISIVFSLSLVVFGFLRYRNGDLDFRDSLKLLIGALIPWLFPIAWIIGNIMVTGNPLHFMDYIQSYKGSVYGESRSYYNYLKTFLRTDPLATVLAGFALVFSFLRNKGSWAVRWYILITSIPFFMFVFLHGGQIEPQGNYFRYLGLFIYIAYPAVAYLIYFGVDSIARTERVKTVLLVIFLAAIGVAQIYSAFQFVNDPAAGGLAVGQRIKILRQERPELAFRPVIIELSYWQYLAIHVGANDISSIIYDRELDWEGRQTLSLLETDVDTFHTCLSHYGVSHIIVKSPDLISVIERDLGITPTEEINEYVFYQVPESLSGSNTPSQLTCPLTFGTGY